MGEIASLLRSGAQARATRDALACGDAVLTFGDLAERSERLAARLGIEPGQRVAVVAPNVPALVIGLFAVWHTGGVAVPLSSRLRSFELERAFADAEPALTLVAGPDVLVEAVQTATAGRVIVLDRVGEVAAEREAQDGARPAGDPLDAGVAAVLYTSGTTGEPKGVPVPHTLAELEASELARLLGDRADAPVGFVIPIPHAFGFACLLAAVAAGATAILIDQATSLAALEQGMRRHRGRVLHGTPSLFARMLATDLDLGVELGFTAGSACPPKVLEALDRGGARILNLYGMTEIGAASACHPDDPPAVRHHTVGRALEGYEFRVADQEVQVRGPFASSYLHRPWADDEASADGWFRTGDLGSLDADGVLTISGRSKDVVHVGGFNVFPAEVESFLLTHPAIEQAAVIGVPHRALGEALRAFVVPDPGAELQPAAVIRFARAGIAGYKVPYQVQVVDELPLLASGKPDRRALADMVQSDSAVA